VRDDEVARHELDEPADDDRERSERRAGRRTPEAVAAETLERLDRAAMIRVEPLRAGQRRPPRELRQHLALPRRGDVQLVQEGRDRVVVAGKEPQALERVVEPVADTQIAAVAGVGDPRHGESIVRRCYASGK
jgi:hypothetical protein